MTGPTSPEASKIIDQSSFPISAARNPALALKSTMSRELTTQYAGLFVQLILKARGVVRSIDAENDLVFLRVRTKKHEVLVAPDSAYVLLVVQDPDAHGGH